MSVLAHTVWIILILFIDSFFPLDCKAAIETKESWMEDDEDSHARFVLKPGRRLLDSRDSNYQPTLRDSPYYYHNNSDNGTVIYCIVALLLTVIVALIKCCIKYASEESEDPDVRIVHPPPARSSVHPPVRLPSGSRPLAPPARSSGGSRPLAPPMTSRSLILFPEDREYQTIFLGIENPAFDPYPIHTISNPTPDPTPIQQGRSKRKNPTPLLDLPPDYDAVINEQSATRRVITSKDNEMEAPPKYDEF